MPQYAADPRKLSSAVEIAFRRMEHVRKARHRFLMQFCGRFYSRQLTGETEDHRASPLSLMYQGVSTLVPNLVSQDPQFRCNSQILAYRPYAQVLEIALTHLANNLKVKQTLRKCIVDAIFLAGFMKTGLADGGINIEQNGEFIPIGQPFADRVDPDDMILDPMARDWEEMEFVGNRFRLPLDQAKESGIYDPAGMDKLTSRYDEGKWKQEAEALFDGGRAAKEMGEITQYVDLCEIYLRRENLMVTIPYGALGKDLGFLRVVPFEGPYCGPYHMLGFSYVPDQVLPVAPASAWYDLHILGNKLARKMARQADRSKRVLAYESSALDDAAAIADAEDGETIRVDSINAIKEVQYGGTTEDSYEFMAWVQKNFSDQSGNTDILGGKGSNEPTATQAEMVQSGASVRLADLKGMVYDFTADIGRTLGFYLHTDPLIELPLIRRVQGVDQQVMYTPEMRQGDFYEYAIRVIPYSMDKQDPKVKVRRIMEFASTVIPAMAQAFSILGPAFKIDQALALVARESGLDEADELIDSQMLNQTNMMKMMGATPDGNAAKMMGGGAPPPGGGRPVQPNPSQMGPTGGVTDETLTNQAQQETAGELQSAYLG